MGGDVLKHLTHDLKGSNAKKTVCGHVLKVVLSKAVIYSTVPYITGGLSGAVVRTVKIFLELWVHDSISDDRRAPKSAKWWYSTCTYSMAKKRQWISPGSIFKFGYIIRTRYPVLYNIIIIRTVIISEDPIVCILILYVSGYSSGLLKYCMI